MAQGGLDAGYLNRSAPGFAVAAALRCAVAAVTGAPLAAVAVDAVVDVATGATLRVDAAANAVVDYACGGGGATLAPRSRALQGSPASSRGFRATLGVRFVVDPGSAVEGAAQLAAKGAAYAAAAAAAAAALGGGATASGGAFDTYLAALADASADAGEARTVEELRRALAFSGRGNMALPTAHPGAAAVAGSSLPGVSQPWGSAGAYAGIVLSVAAVGALLAAAARARRNAAKPPSASLRSANLNPLSGGSPIPLAAPGAPDASSVFGAANPLLLRAARARGAAPTGEAAAAAARARGMMQPGEAWAAPEDGGVGDAVAAAALPRPALSLAAYFQPDAAAPAGARARAAPSGLRSPQKMTPPPLPRAPGRGHSAGAGSGGSVLERAGLARRTSPAPGTAHGGAPLPGEPLEPRRAAAPAAAAVLQRRGLSWRGGGATVTSFNPVARGSPGTSSPLRTLPARSPQGASPAAGAASPATQGMTLRLV